jgi:IPT/TIG domain
VGVNGDKTGAPGLAALANNGGPTDTLALLAGSPAIAAGNATTCAQPPVSQADQRGDARRAGSRGSCGIGAYDTGGVPGAGAVTPAHGSTSGGTAVTVTGSGFTKVSKVLFGTVAGTKMQVVSPTKLTVVSPGHAAGTMRVRVVNTYGESAVNATSAFAFH